MPKLARLVFYETSQTRWHDHENPVVFKYHLILTWTQVWRKLRPCPGETCTKWSLLRICIRQHNVCFLLEVKQFVDNNSHKKLQIFGDHLAELTMLTAYNGWSAHWHEAEARILRTKFRSYINYVSSRSQAAITSGEHLIVSCFSLLRQRLFEQPKSSVGNKYHVKQRSGFTCNHMRRKVRNSHDTRSTDLWSMFRSRSLFWDPLQNCRSYCEAWSSPYRAWVPLALPMF